MGDLAVIERASTNTAHDGDKPMRRKCAAHLSDGSGTPCDSNIVMANGKCKAHGGKTPRGIAHPNYKTGEWCKDLPARLRDRAGRAFADPDLLSQKKAIAILEARFWDVMASTSNQESGELWQSLYEAKQTYFKARGKDTENTRARALQDIWYLIIEGYNERQSWREMRKIIQELRTVRESEQRSLINKQQNLSTAEAMVMLGHVSFAMKDAASLITDPEQRKAVLDKVSRTLASLVNVPDR